MSRIGETARQLLRQVKRRSRWMLHNDRKIPVVLSAADERHFEMVGKGAVVGFVPKTANASALIGKIAEALRNKMDRPEG